MDLAGRLSARSRQHCSGAPPRGESDGTNYDFLAFNVMEAEAGSRLTMTTHSKICRAVNKLRPRAKGVDLGLNYRSVTLASFCYNMGNARAGPVLLMNPSGLGMNGRGPAAQLCPGPRVTATRQPQPMFAGTIPLLDTETALFLDSGVVFVIPYRVRSRSRKLTLRTVGWFLTVREEHKLRRTGC
jgi:hypothetical protein